MGIEFIVSLEEYLKDFVPTLNNFIDKCPVNVHVSIIKETGFIYVCIYDAKNEKEIDGMSFQIDPLSDKKNQIKKIKMFLEDYYPVISQVINVPYDKEELEKIVEQGTPIQEALKLRKQEKIPVYKIIRVHHKYNDMDCLNLATNEIYKVKLQQPIEIFLRSFWEDSISASNTFFKISKIVGNIGVMHK